MPNGSSVTTRDYRRTGPDEQVQIGSGATAALSVHPERVHHTAACRHPPLPDFSMTARSAPEESACSAARTGRLAAAGAMARVWASLGSSGRDAGQDARVAA